jgi:hypothetical protein
MGRATSVKCKRFGFSGGIPGYEKWRGYASIALQALGPPHFGSVNGRLLATRSRLQKANL